MPGFQIGPFSFHYYGLILGAAIIGAFLTAKFFATRENLSQEIVDEASAILIIPVVLGSRIYHVLHYWGYYSVNLVQIFYIWQGGIGIIGGILAGIATLYIFSIIRKLDFLKLADLASSALALGQSIGRIGNFINIEGFGPPTNLPWGVFVPQLKRPERFLNFSHFHPTFFYESLGDFLIFLILVFFPAKKPGTKFAAYLILYSTLRAGLEFLRIDTWQFGIIKVAQLAAICGFSAGLVVLVKIAKPSWIGRFFI